MTRNEWLVSGFIVWHLFAIFTTALPSRPWVDRPKQSEQSVAFVARVPPSVAAITRFADRTLFQVSRAVAGVRTGALGLLGRPVSAYVDLAHQAQTWAMFANPPTWDVYWRARYYVQPAAGRRWIATELVGPAHREDQVRLFKGFIDSYRDKALEIAYNDFGERRKPSSLRPDTKPSELPNDLTPVARYFARRFSTRLGPGDRIVRTELWYGSAANRPLGAAPEPAVELRRHAVLLAYAEGPIEDRVVVPPYSPYRAEEGEADIRWVLEYYEET